MDSPRRSIEQYIRAKDGNRPHLLAQAFTDDATLDMVVRTGSISFPDHVEGRGAIGDVLVSRFNQTFENVYTFCLDAPLETSTETSTEAFQCRWLVAMSDKHSGEVRVGCGRYDWRFSPQSWLVGGLTITIEHMSTLPATDLPAVMDWVSRLAYPWCSVQAAMDTVPDSTMLQDVIQYLSARWG